MKRYRHRLVRTALRATVCAVAIGSLAVAAGAAPAARRTAPHLVRAKRPPIVIAHRGASGYRPEHTLAAYQLAIDMGADYIEPDLVSTKDGVLVARHENQISSTTDVASHPEFAARRTTKTVDGASLTGWFSEDFTLAELRTLRARERVPGVRPANTAFDGLYPIPTLQEIIDLAKRNHVGLYPETKHPTYFAGIGLSLEEPLVATLDANGYRNRHDPVFIQSFETANLRRLHDMTKLRLVQLLSSAGQPYDFVVSGDPRTYADLSTPAGLREIATYADGIGPGMEQIVPVDAQNRSQQPTTLVADAHRRGLVVHPYAFRRENAFLPADFRAGNPASPTYQQATGNLPGELALFYRLGVDGVFTDNPDVGVAVRTEVFDR